MTKQSIHDEFKNKFQGKGFSVSETVRDFYDTQIHKLLEEVVPKECISADDVRIIIDREEFYHLKNQKMGVCMGYNLAISEIKKNIKRAGF